MSRLEGAWQGERKAVAEPVAEAILAAILAVGLPMPLPLPLLPQPCLRLQSVRAGSWSLELVSGITQNW